MSRFKWIFIISLFFVSSIIFEPEFLCPVYAQLILSIVYDADAGGGNATIPLNVYHPVNIVTNQSANIKWQNPTMGIQYPHTVTFIRADSNLTIPKINSSVSNYSSLIHFSSQNTQSDNAARVDVTLKFSPL
jgi:hypothetical protein